MEKNILPDGVSENIYYKKTRFEENKGYILTDDKWRKLKLECLEANNTQGVSDWRHAVNEKYGFEKYNVYMYSPSLDLLRFQTQEEFYTKANY